MCLYSFLPKNQRKHKEKHVEYTGKKISNYFLVKNLNFLHNKASLHLIKKQVNKKIKIVKNEIEPALCLQVIFVLMQEKYYILKQLHA